MLRFGGITRPLAASPQTVHPTCSSSSATLAGVALAMTIPLRRSPGRPDDPTSPRHVLEHALHPSVAFGDTAIVGVGLSGMRVRVEQLKGTMEVVSGASGT